MYTTTEFRFPEFGAVNLEPTIIFAGCQAKLLPWDVCPNEVDVPDEGGEEGAVDGGGLVGEAALEFIVQYNEYTLLSCP